VHWNPGLAVDPQGVRAFAVQAGSPIAEVDLRTLAVRSAPIRLPTAAAKSDAGFDRSALWLGGGLLAVTGSDMRAKGRLERTTPAGLTLVDTRDWSARTIDPEATSVAYLGGTLLATAWLWDSRAGRATGIGLRAYGRDGSLRYRRFGSQTLSTPEPIGRLAFAGTSLLDPRSGRIVRRVNLRAELLLHDSPFWY
jgi:hypothetical protein